MEPCVQCTWVLNPPAHPDGVLQRVDLRHRVLDLGVLRGPGRSGRVVKLVLYLGSWVGAGGARRTRWRRRGTVPRYDMVLAILARHGAMRIKGGSRVEPALQTPNPGAAH